MSGSSTKYYVSSTTFPLFNRSKVADQFLSAVIDQTLSSSVELSEYLKSHYRNTKLWNFRNFIDWCNTSGYNRVLGSVESYFYTDADISNTAVAAAIKGNYTLGANDTFGVNKANLNFFNVDFWVRHLATQQGKATLFGSNNDENYTIEYPTSTTVKAVFSTGEVIQGNLPTFASNTRFLEISYSIDKVTTTTSKDETTGETTTVTNHDLTYGYYHYQEGGGNTALDALIKNNGIKTTYTFFPVIPLRTDTAWLGTNGRIKAGSALKHLNIIAERVTDESAYWTLCNALEKGMTEGNMGDIDYITYIPGINITTRDKASQKYLFEFFYNCYYNCALAHGETPAHIDGGICTYNGKRVITSASRKLLKKYKDAAYTRNFYRSFNICNATSNLNLTYQWAGAEYYDNNGTFKPNAKPGDYGVLAGKYEYKYVVLEPVRNEQGNVIVDEDGHIDYVPVTYTTTYNLVFFCHQVSKNRWRSVSFVDLYLNNLVYHGKYVDTCAYDAVKDSSNTGSVVIDFSDDFDPSLPGDDTYRVITFEYVESPGAEDDSAFVVPLELNTFREIGAVCQYQVVSLCHFLVYNCWVKVKKKWYQRGFFSVVVSAVGFVLSAGLVAIPIPAIQLAGIVTMTYFATMLAMTLAALTLSMSLHILQAVFGEQLGTRLYNYATNEIADIVCGILNYYGGWIGMIISAAIKFGIASGTALNNGESQWVAFREGAKAGGVSAAASYASNYAGSYTSSALGSSTNAAFNQALVASASAATYAGVSTFGTAILSGTKFSTALRQALLNAIVSGVQAGAGSYAKSLFSSAFPSLMGDANQSQSLGTSSANATPTNTGWVAIKEALMSQIVKNPMTYINLINMSQEARLATKLQNLENDYEELNNEIDSANKLLNSLMAQSCKMATAQESLRLQVCMGRLTTMIPETNMDLSWDRFRAMALASGLDHCKVTLGCTTSFVDNALTLNGYSPSSLYFTDTDYTLTWDND